MESGPESLPLDAVTDLLRRRVGALSIPDEDMEAAAAVIAAAGMRLPGAAKQLRREWLNDILASQEGSLFRAASADPAAHFIEWAGRRAADRYHVTWRAIEQVSRRLGPEVANRMALVIWPQEIAWAQRSRMSDNPHAAMRAAMFLREAEGNPAAVFASLADIYGEAFIRADYSASSAHSLSPSEIRTGESVPEFSPLFMRHAARAYAETLNSMPRARVEALAARARSDEAQERASLSNAAAVAAARRFPLRRVLTVVASASAQGVTPNDVFLAEDAFLATVAEGKVEVDPRSRTPQAEFVAALADPAARTRLVAAGTAPALDGVALQWEIASFGKRWVSDLPESFRKLSQEVPGGLASWQSAVIEGRRDLPFDPVSDFGFFLYGNQ